MTHIILDKNFKLKDYLNDDCNYEMLFEAMLKGRFRTTNCGSESSFTQGPINQEPDIRLTKEKRFQVTFLTVFKIIN
ncbi:hypothetical protein T11_15430 [Trichinella zimbabwensis]|uniref:Uncharacterized protein n=1 Tax=Trichinella zimbabwensis TaxID=268475 RepID=A0A0V1HJ72_9BILA|nr:hypothetical protein T11_15430 [Trichinella zimbabwensis]